MFRLARLLLACALLIGLGAGVACGGAVAQEGTPPPPDAGMTKKAPPTPGQDTPPDTSDGSSDSPVVSSIVADEFGAEVQLAVSQTGRIVVAWIGIGGAMPAIRYAFSDDDGTTFSRAASVGSTVGDPVVGALDDGSFLLGGLRANCPTIDTCTDGELFLSRLPAGATTLQVMPSLREPSNAFIDHPWMSVHGEDVSLIGAVFPLQDGGAYQYGMTVWRSPDRGSSFERTELVVAQAVNEVGIPRFCGGDGTRTWAHFYDGTASTFGRLRWTDGLDDGWTATNSASAGGDGAGALQTTGACAAHGSTLYALIGTPASGSAGGMDVTPTFSDLHLVATSNLGATWTELGVLAVGSAQYLLPEIDVEPDGTIVIFYYTGDTLNGAGRAETVLRRAGAASLDPPVVLRSGLGFVADRGSPRWLGDYNAIGFAGGHPVFAFGDNGSSQTRIRFATLAN
jgi:hypothetical protein